MTLRDMRVTVFGGSRPQPGETEYINAYQLGEMLGKLGCTVLTGGYIGTMEAVSRGAAENGAYVIGVTCDEIEAYRPISPNSWLSEELRFPTIRQRIYTLITECEIAIALPGGVGTLTEIATMWNHLLIGAIAPRPMILIGSGWRFVMDSFFQSFNEYIPREQRSFLNFAENNQTAIKIMHQRNRSEPVN